MNTIKNLVSAVALTAVASSASALTAVIQFEGTVDKIIAPASLGIAENDAFATSQPYSGQVVIKNFNDFYQYDRNIRNYVSQVTSPVDVSTDERIGFTITHPQMQAMEGQRGFIPNPNFNADLPVCSSRDISRERNGCDSNSVENPSWLRLDENATNFGNLLGNAKLTITDTGLPVQFNWEFGRTGKLNPNFDPTQEEGRRNRKFLNSVASYDEWLMSNNVPFLFKKVALELSNLEFDRQENEFVYFKADKMLTVEVQEVPVPAAAWLFGSAMLGLAGIKRRK